MSTHRQHTLLSACSPNAHVPPPAPAPHPPQDHKRNDYKNILSKNQLLASLANMNMLALAPPEVRQLHELLTSDFSPLELCARLAPLLEKIADVGSSMSGASPVKDINMWVVGPGHGACC